MSDAKEPGKGSLLRHASPLIIGRSMTALLTFFIPIVLARRLSPLEYGTYKQFFLVAATLYLGGQLGLAGSLYFFVPRCPNERARYIVQALTSLLVLGAFAGVVVWAGAGLLARRFDNPAFAALGLPLGLYCWFQLGAAPLEISLTALGRTGWSGITYVVSDVARTAALIAPIGAGIGLPGLAWAAVGFAALRLLTAWILTFTIHRGAPLLPTRTTMRRQLWYSLPFGAAILLSVAQMQLPQYLVAGMTSTATFALYSVGCLQLPITDMLYGPIAEVMMVRLAGCRPGQEPAIFREAVSRLILFFLPLLAFSWAVSSELITTMYTAQYAAAAPIFTIAACEIGLSALPVDGLLRSLDATRVIFRINCLRLVVAIVIVPLGLHLFGLLGAMGGYILVQAMAKTTLLVLAARRLGVKAASLLPRQQIASWVARSAIIYFAVTAIHRFGPWHGWLFFGVALPVAGLLWLAALVSAGELRFATLFRRASAPEAPLA